MELIGFIGIGTMGKGMIENLLKNDFKVIGFNRTKSKAESIRHENFQVAKDIGELSSKSEIIFTCVSNDSALKEVLYSENGVLANIGKDKIIADCSTTSSELTREINESCKNKGCMFLDAPITGSKIGAETGQIVFMIGGPKHIFDKCKPLWDAMGKKAVYCGPSGHGQKVKYALNLTQALILESYLEGISFAIKNGADFNSVIEVLENSAAKNGVGSIKLPYILNRDFTPHFLFKHMHKDLKIAEKEIDRLNLKLPLSNSIFEQFYKGQEMGLDDEDFCSIVKILEDESGIKLKK